MKTFNNNLTDRENLEWLVWYCLNDEHPPITMSRGRELLGFSYMEDMRKFMNEYKEFDGSSARPFFEKAQEEDK